MPFVPMSGVVFDAGTTIGERLLYMPSIGFCFFLAWAGTWVSQCPQGLVKLEIGADLHYEFTIDYRGRRYTGAGILEDDFLQERFCCWTDYPAEAFLSLCAVYEGCGPERKASSDEIDLAVVIEPYGHVGEFEGVARRLGVPTNRPNNKGCSGVEERDLRLHPWLNKPGEA